MTSINWLALVQKTLVCLAVLLLVACSQTEQQASDAKVPASYDANSWKSIIADSCQSFFDGCNQCRREPGAEVAACTRKACFEYQEPYCLDRRAGEFTHVRYQCKEGERFEVFYGEYRADDMRVKLEENEVWLSNTQTHTAHRLQRVQAASGEKFSDGSVTYWQKNNSAIVLIDEATHYMDCQPRVMNQ